MKEIFEWIISFLLILIADMTIVYLTSLAITPVLLLILSTICIMQTIFIYNKKI